MAFYNEFLPTIRPESSKPDDALFEKFFTEYDTDGNGRITKAEMGNFFSKFIAQHHN